MSHSYCFFQCLFFASSRPLITPMFKVLLIEQITLLYNKLISNGTLMQNVKGCIITLRLLNTSTTMDDSIEIMITTIDPIRIDNLATM